MRLNQLIRELQKMQTQLADTPHPNPRVGRHDHEYGEFGEVTKVELGTTAGDNWDQTGKKPIAVLI